MCGLGDLKTQVWIQLEDTVGWYKAYRRTLSYVAEDVHQDVLWQSP